MIVTKIEGFTNVLSAPYGWDASQNGECLGLPVKIEPYGDTISSTSAWKPTPEEMEALAAGAELRLRVIGGQPPVSLHVETAPENLIQDYSEIEARRELLLAKVVQLCGSQFEAYAALHAAKRTPDGDEKAATNRKLAKICSDVIAGMSVHEPKPAAAVDSSYVEAFYDLAKMMGLGARAASPAEVWKTEMRPKLAEIINCGDARA